MRYLFVVGHPAHVHFFKYAIRTLRERGHETLVGAVSREVTVQLLRAYRLEYFVFGRSWSSLLAKAIGVVPKDIALLMRAGKFRPDIVVSTGIPYAAHVATILGAPHIAFGDTERAVLVARLTLPFTDLVCTPASFEADLGSKHIRYNGCKELAYLHPNYFQSDASVLGGLGLESEDRIVIVRFAAWDSSHDLRDSGFRFESEGAALDFLASLEQYGKVLLTSDKRLGPSFKRYLVSVPPQKMHDLLSCASLYVGEGATMAAEAGVLGVPWVFVSQTGRGFLREQEVVYGLGRTVKGVEAAQEVVPELLAPSVPEEWRVRRNRFLADKEDVVRFVVGVLENYPEIPSDRGRHSR